MMERLRASLSVVLSFVLVSGMLSPARANPHWPVSIEKQILQQAIPGVSLSFTRSPFLKRGVLTLGGLLLLAVVASSQVGGPDYMQLPISSQTGYVIGRVLAYSIGGGIAALAVVFFVGIIAAWADIEFSESSTKAVAGGIEFVFLAVGAWTAEWTRPTHDWIRDPSTHQAAAQLQNISGDEMRFVQTPSDPSLWSCSLSPEQQKVLHRRPFMQIRFNGQDASVITRFSIEGRSSLGPVYKKDSYFAVPKELEKDHTVFRLVGVKGKHGKWRVFMMPGTINGAWGYSHAEIVRSPDGGWWLLIPMEDLLRQLKQIYFKHGQRYDYKATPKNTILPMPTLRIRVNGISSPLKNVAVEGAFGAFQPRSSLSPSNSTPENPPPVQPKTNRNFILALVGSFSLLIGMGSASTSSGNSEGPERLRVALKKHSPKVFGALDRPDPQWLPAFIESVVSGRFAWGLSSRYVPEELHTVLKLRILEGLSLQVVGLRMRKSSDAVRQRVELILNCLSSAASVAINQGQSPRMPSVVRHDPHIDNLRRRLQKEYSGTFGRNDATVPDWVWPFLSEVMARPVFGGMKWPASEIVQIFVHYIVLGKKTHRATYVPGLTPRQIELRIPILLAHLRKLALDYSNDLCLRLPSTPDASDNAIPNTVLARA